MIRNTPFVVLHRRTAVFCLMLFSITAPVVAAEIGFAGADLDSAGDPGDPDNGLVAVTYDGPSTIFTSFEFSGILTAVIPDTFGSEAFLQVTNVTQGYTFSAPTNSDDDELGNGINFLPGLPPLAAFFFANQGDQFLFETVEDFDDGPGPDAHWENMTVRFSDDRPVTDLGEFDPGSFILDAISFDFPTTVGVYASDGALLDGGIGEFDPPELELGPGLYYLVVGGEDSEFDDFLAVTSLFDTASEFLGDFVSVEFNGQIVGSGRVEGEGPNLAFQFTVNAVPEPNALLLALTAACVVCFQVRTRRRT